MFLSVIPRKRAGWRLTEESDGLTLTSTKNDQQIRCNQTAALIWRLIDGRRNIRTIIDTLRELYPDVESIEEDIEIIVDDFVMRRAVEYSESV